MDGAVRKILIAGRGEIAVRVMETCRERGLECVGLHTEAEKNLPHVLRAQESFCLGEGPLSETYLNIEKILRIAKEAKAQAIHPCYGLLSEEASFARRVREEGLLFVGPSAHVMELMASKIEARKKMEEIGVPVIPGYHGGNQEVDFLKRRAEDMGLPILIKASKGGGGKGMRLVRELKDFSPSLEGAKREAQQAFGDGTVFLEKFIECPRHIEVQIMSDTHGNHLHFFERECSIQRRYQKIIEETPSQALSQPLREKITETAVHIAHSVGYEGAGTVEFMLDSRGEFYFLEMNTRLQVEHPITEMVTGEDLVDLQLRVAMGEKLTLGQGDIVSRGHALELRLYAENPDEGFLPQTGTLLRAGRVSGRHTRLDAGLGEFNRVAFDFDPLLAKLSVWGPTREVCRVRALLALEEIPLLGVQTNRDYLARVLCHKKFREAETPIDFVETHRESLAKVPLSAEEKALGVASFLFLQRKKKHGVLGPRPSVRTAGIGWRG